MAHYEDNASKVYTSSDHIERVKTNDTIWYRGHVITDNGIVAVWYSGPVATLLVFAKDGRQHYRRFSRGFQPQYLVTLAKRFAADIATQPDTNA